MARIQYSKLTATTKSTQGDGYSPQDLAKIYHFPSNSGEGQTIGILALGGVFSSDDLTQFCDLFKLTVPTVNIVGTVPPSNSAADLETNLDIQMIAGMAPKATIVLYYCSSFSNGFQKILNDKKHKINVISTSWAIGEDYLDSNEKQRLKEQMKALSKREITILAASGDNGIYQAGNNAGEKQITGVNLPAAFEEVIACGGTTCYSDGRETVWNEDINFEGTEMNLASGGSFSTTIPAPNFQKTALSNYAKNDSSAPTTKIATPDISANASKAHFTTMISKGKISQAFGTSAATPILAGLIARLNVELGYSLGNCNERLYQLMGTKAFNSSIAGNNSTTKGEDNYTAASDWDPCTGLGSPNGLELLRLLKEQDKKAPATS